MNNQYDALERSFLADHTGLVARNSEAHLITERHPLLYTLFLIAAGLFGYAFLFMFPLTVLAIAVAIPGTIIAAQNELDVILVLSGIGIASFAAWLSMYLYKTRPALPAGRPLKKEEAPLLLEMITETARTYGAPDIHMIRIVRDYHVEIVKTPRNGFPLLYTNTLLIGLPVLQCLTPKQLTQIVGREIIHLSKVYRRPYGWAFFLNQTWCQYRQTHQSGWHPASIIMSAFFIWYAPLYKLISMAACQEEEFYADNIISQADRNFSFADTLTTQSIQVKFLQDRFWPDLLNMAYRHQQPPFLPYSQLEKELCSKLDYTTAQQYLDAALGDDDGTSRQPPLKHRLDRLGIRTPKIPELDDSTHATNYLTRQGLALIIRQMDSIWQKSTHIEWLEKYRTGQQEQSTLKELQVQTRQGLLTDGKAREYIQLIRKYMDYQDAVPLYREVLDIDLDDAHISFDIGRTLLEHMDPLGVTALESAMRKDPEYTVMACQLITQYFVHAGNSREAQSYRRRALAYQVEAA